VTALEARAEVDPAPSDAPPPPDWAALLAGGGLGTVTVVGPLTPDARRALEAAVPASPGRRADTVIVTDDRPSQVRAGLARVRPGGTLRIERSRRRWRPVSRQILRRAGLVDVATWWHRPNAADPRCLIRLEDGVAAATVVRSVGDRRRRTWAEAMVARTGLADLLSTEVSILARAPGGDDDAPLAEPPLGRRIDGLVTPGFRRSRAVIGVSTVDGGRRLHGVAKVARRPEDDAAVAAEAEVLAALAAHAPFPGAPQGARAVARAGRQVLVEEAVQGQPLDRRTVRRDPVGALVAGRRWIDALPRSAPSVPAEDGRADALLRAPLAAVSARHGVRAETVRRAAEVLGHLEGCALPVVFEHGDLSHPNLFLGADGSLGAVDWERARPSGLPLHDLVFLVAYLTESIEPVGSHDELGRAVVRALRPHGWARPELDVHAERLGLDRAHLRGLEIACWTRRVAELPPGPTPDGRPHRDVALWTAAVDDAVGANR
jgi:hypothetical protein